MEPVQRPGELMPTEEFVSELTALELEVKRRRLAFSGPDFVREQLGEHPWSIQQRIMNSVRDNRRTAVPSCHGAGKSFISARIAAWWLSRFKPGEAFVVTSAPTGRQVRAILWREIGRAHSKGNLAGKTNQTEWWMPIEGSKDEMVAFGMKPSDYDPTAFQGIHARYVLVIFDEACGIPTALWEAADSLISNDESRFLAIGNPDDPKSEFANVCKPGSGWSVIHISAYDTPNLTGEQVPELMKHVLVGKLWVEEKLRKWGVNNPLYISKVLGQFPLVADDGLIPAAWITAAQERNLEPETEDEKKIAAETWKTELGVDVGGGGDKNIVAKKWGPIVRVIRRDQEPNTMVSCGKLINDIRETGATLAKVDEIGIGRGMAERAVELDAPVLGVNVGSAPKDKESFVNLRAEGYWLLRERFQEGQMDIDPNDDDLAGQLAEIKFKRSSSGKIQIESKDEMKRRGLHSPDDADAVMLAVLPEAMCGNPEIIEHDFAWG